MKNVMRILSNINRMSDFDKGYFLGKTEVLGEAKKEAKRDED